MKKVTLVVAALLFSGAVSAQKLEGSDLVPVTTCTNLNEDVKINLTVGVVAGVNCATERVALSACHTGGMLKSRSVYLKPDPVDATKKISCTAGEAGCVSTPVSGAAVPSATTLAGTVNNQYPGTGACTSTVAETVAGSMPKQ